MIALIIGLTFFKTYAGVPIKKADYYTLASYTTNIQKSVNSSSSRASQNVVYLAKADKLPQSLQSKTKQAQKTQSPQKRVNAYQSFLRGVAHRLTNNPDDQVKLTNQLIQNAHL
ncbi:hypothetical protein LOSG293_240140 [Secundilactobacillus oryzae JCM 18671]|uniref:Uncharacterized protein n=1 Tax=Secundilactobacillus oryzae JCM 18671 TaxID=1291743 RepID=A0A081BJS9_9LACO|nr:hypothetical protein [Secundilactobacillus oryzae]GAK48297.1 hypothetical protein LOSG293_240140 [Secundilactobacillus oryzae JCM 18671]